jgi:hypothetical protein
MVSLDDFQCMGGAEGDTAMAVDALALISSHATCCFVK